MNIKKNIFLAFSLLLTSGIYLHAVEAPEDLPAQSRWWSPFGGGLLDLNGPAARAGKSIEESAKTLGKSFSLSTYIFSAFMKSALENAAKDIRVDGKIAFDGNDLVDIRRITDNVKDTAFYLTHAQATAKIDPITLGALDRALLQADDIAERIAHPRISISQQTLTQIGIISAAGTAFYFAGSTLKELASKYINRSSETDHATDGVIAGTSCALLVGSACSMYYSGRLAGNTPLAITEQEHAGVIETRIVALRQLEL